MVYVWLRPDQYETLFMTRLDASHMLELLRGKRLVFVGDSLNRNMWESLVCILRNSAKDKSKVYEANGKTHFRGEASYSFIFKVGLLYYSTYSFLRFGSNMSSIYWNLCLTMLLK